jgi:GH25 family lysozyme M1 (1,4-beta-N-acetylmuramidase)
MQDFNPNTRVRGEFFYPVRTENFLTKATSYLTSILAEPVRIRGIDLSHWNGKVDFEAVKLSGIDFVILKATESDWFLDDTFDYNWRASLANELVAMPYHFFRSNVKGNPQVEWFFRAENGGTFVEEVEGKTCLWWDVETSDNTSVTARQNRLYGACTLTVGKGLQTGYYSSPYKWNSLIGNVPWADDFWGWVAHWADVAYPSLPTGWTREKTRVWQNGIYPNYSWVEPVEGVQGSVDHNYFFGTLQELRDWLGYTPPPPTPDCCDKIEAIEQELVVVKSRIAQLELNDMRQEDRLNTIDQRLTDAENMGVLNDHRITQLENLIQQVKDILCL